MICLRLVSNRAATRTAKLLETATSTTNNIANLLVHAPPLLTQESRRQFNCNAATASSSPSTSDTAIAIDVAATNEVINCAALLERAVLHRNRVSKLLAGELYKDINHPIYNFLFKYYSFNKVRLFSYSPGLDTRVANFLNDDDYYRAYCATATGIGSCDDEYADSRDSLGSLIFHSFPNAQQSPPSSTSSSLSSLSTSSVAAEAEVCTTSNPTSHKTQPPPTTITTTTDTFSRRFSPKMPPPHPYSIASDDDHQGELVIRPKMFTKNQLRGLTAARDILKSSYKKLPSYACYGLHEWAMVYKPTTSESGLSTSTSTQISDAKDGIGRNFHQGNLSLRLSEVDIGAFVESRSLRCTHFDAFRFFSKAAIPRNATQLKGYPEKVEQEQPGCLHVHMDLFKWALKLFPYLPSELIGDSLEIALLSREIDMRASPYDLNSYQSADGRLVGLGRNFNPTPIYIETPEGRKEYQRCQEALYKLSQPVRKELLACYDRLLSIAESSE